MLPEPDFTQIHNYLIKTLPELLRQPEIITIIEDIVAQQFVKHDEFTQVLNEIKLLREDMQRRFEQVDQRLEQVDRRFEQQQQEMNRRFDEQHRDTLDLKRRVIKMESNMEVMADKMTKFDAWLNIIAGNIGTEKGQNLEELFALGLSYGLKNREILPETIQLQQEFMDKDCLVYSKKWKSIEVDIIAENGKLTIFEVKATAVETDIDTFAKKVELIQRQNPDKQVQGILISPGAKDKIKECCTEYEIELID